MRPRTAACIPGGHSERVEALGTFMAVVGQTVKPDRIIILDSSIRGLDSNRRLSWLSAWANAEVIREMGAPPGLARHRLAEEADDCYFLWFVDDDVWPMPDCLERLLAAHYNERAIAPQVIEAQSGRRNNQESKIRNLWTSPWKKDALILSGGCLLANRSQWLAAEDPKDFSLPVGEDALVTARMSEGGSMAIAGDALAFHLQPEPNYQFMPAVFWDRLRETTSKKHYEKLRRRFDFVPTPPLVPETTEEEL